MSKISLQQKRKVQQCEEKMYYSVIPNVEIDCALSVRTLHPDAAC